MIGQTYTEAPRPPLLMSAEDHARLVGLAGVIRIRNPLLAHLLMQETKRAEVVPAGQVPADVVAVGSVVEFIDTAFGEPRRVQVVLPGKADIEAGRISILSLVGAGLIGLSQGQSIDWPAQGGRLRRLTVLRVEPLAAGTDIGANPEPEGASIPDAGRRGNFPQRRRLPGMPHEDCLNVRLGDYFQSRRYDDASRSDAEGQHADQRSEQDGHMGHQPEAASGERDGADLEIR